MKSDLVTAVIPSFNRYESLVSAIDSIKEQTYKNIEIVVIDDNSTDINYKKLEKNKDIKYLKNIEIGRYSIKPGAVRNRALEVANGSFLAFLDDDDIWLPNKIELQIEKMKSTGLKMSCSESFWGEGKYNPDIEYLMFNSEKHFREIKKRLKKKNYKLTEFPDVFKKSLIEKHNLIVTSSVVVETELFKFVGGFRNLKPFFEDYDCWLALLSWTDCCYLKEPLIYYDGLHAGGKKY
jgi:glycosyltransferase involved in cell wall biosynthesis